MYDDSDSMADQDIYEKIETQNTIPLQTHKRRSYVWRYFNPVPDHLEIYRCKICSETFGNKTTNLSRHLQTSHGITEQQQQQQDDAVKKGRPNRSFVWNFCTKLDDKRALCHICKKILYFGGGNTSNITKHLRRMHAEKLEEVVKQMPRTVRWSMEPSLKKERKASSYVWNYCEKLANNIVLCRLCNRHMQFHGTANVITHLQRRHDIMDETTTVKIEAPEKVLEAATSSTSDHAMQRPCRRGSLSGSLVWRYITRISDETVRCRVCLKILSYQGTSNLQRHLHRMHNIKWTGQESRGLIKVEADDNTFFSFCESTTDPTVWKCQMCEVHFENNDVMEETISKHMIKIHSAAMRGESSEDLVPTGAEDEDFAALYTEVVAEEGSAVANVGANPVSAGNVDDQIYPTNAVAEDALYDDLIEIEEDIQEVQESGENVVSDYSNDSTDAQLVTTTIQADDTPLMRELKEDLLRQQAMYFNEKAGFYRMQKFLVAQQVRKERLEIEKLKAGRAQLPHRVS